jgi:arylsulfatase A-like enzyme/Flp pilus assembly protein TadD
MNLMDGFCRRPVAKIFFPVVRLSAILAGLFLAFSHASAQAVQKEAGGGRLNVLIITVDTLRADRLGCYGNTHVKTPNIDSLAQRGALFNRAFAHTPTTLPSHTNILLGTTPVYHGVHDNHNFIVREEFLTLAEHLKTSGYATGAFVGAFPLDSRFGLTQGFDVYDDNYGTSGSQEFSYVERKAEVVVGKAVEWLKKQGGPWFLWVHCFDPHQRYEPPEPFKTEYSDRPYDGEVAYVDYSLGKLLDFVRNGRLEDKTLVIFTGDHGESLGQHGESTHGYFAYNSALWVPLVIAYPGLKPEKIDQPAAHIDIFPTVCEVLGARRPSHLQGVSLVPAINGKKLPERALYFESLYPYYTRGWAPLTGYIREATKFMDSPIPELYDLKKDFDETQNLAESARLDKYKAELAELTKKEAYVGPSASGQRADRQTLESLKSLGYLSSPQAPRKEAFTAQDDLKILLPYQSRLQQAMAAYHKGDIEKGAELLRGIIAERKDFDLAYTYLATIYKEQRKLKEAVGVLREGYQNCPGSYKVIITFGMFLTDVGAFDQAIDILKKGLAIIDYDPELWNYLGVAYWKKGDFEEASKALHQALSLDENYPIAINNLGSVYLSAYLKTKEAGALQKAVGNFKKAIELDPRYESAYNGLGTALKISGDLDGAILNWKKAVEIKPDYGFALYNLGLAYLIKGEKASAREYLQKYKSRFYTALPPNEQQKLDELIAQCK